MFNNDRPARLNILALEPYYGGSHRAFIDTLIRHSAHRIRLLRLPARKWKWRMRGAALWFAEQLAKTPPEVVDLIFTNDMLSVADLRALMPAALRRCPIVCYFHENQLTYPLAKEDERDYHFGFTNITSCLASDEVWFNSSSHREAFVAAVQDLLHKMPDYVPEDVVGRIKKRSCVCWPLVEPPPPDCTDRARVADGPPTILWNHRWEYDKNPEPFFRTLFRLDAAGVDFKLVLLGESFRRIPTVFAEAWGLLERRITHCGFVRSRSEYWRLLRRCDIVVSTAHQENFGLSIVEAILAGCRPLLPRRLSYPELIPKTLQERYLFDSVEDLYVRLKSLLSSPVDFGADPMLINHLWSRCAVAGCIDIYDSKLRDVAPGWE